MPAVSTSDYQQRLPARYQRVRAINSEHQRVPSTITNIEYQRIPKGRGLKHWARQPNLQTRRRTNTNNQLQLAIIRPHFVYILSAWCRLARTPHAADSLSSAHLNPPPLYTQTIVRISYPRITSLIRLRTYHDLLLASPGPPPFALHIARPSPSV